MTNCFVDRSYLVATRDYFSTVLVATTALPSMFSVLICLCALPFLSHGMLWQTTSLTLSHDTTTIEDKCNEKLFTTCSKRFCDVLDLPCRKANAAHFVFALNGLVDTKGLAGFQEMCGVFENMIDCYGSESAAEQCNTIEHYLALNMTLANANTYALAFRQVEMECGEHRELFETYFPCLYDVGRVSHKAEIDECYANFSIAQTDDHHCDNYQKYIVDCPLDVYAHYCGLRIRHPICEFDRDVMSQFIGECRIECNGAQ